MEAIDDFDKRNLSGMVGQDPNQRRLRIKSEVREEVEKGVK